MFRNYANSDTPIVSNDWKNKNQYLRKKEINDYLIEKGLKNKIKVLHCSDEGNVELCMLEIITVSERGLFLIGLEEDLKLNFDKGLTVWCEPLGDKNSLRNLRGIKIK